MSMNVKIELKEVSHRPTLARLPSRGLPWQLAVGVGPLDRQPDLTDVLRAWKDIVGK
jgi:hypothetical protein